MKVLTSLKRVENKDLFWFLLFIVGAVFLRFFSFFPSQIDHDESTYAIIGSELVNGKRLYTDVTDTKPVGILLVYTALQYLFGYSIFMKRLFAAVLVGMTSYFVRKISFSLFKSGKAANAAGTIYLFYTSTWGYFGLSPNTELYFNLFTILALLFFMKGGNRNFLFAGLMAGIGFMFKYLVLLDFAAFVLFFFILDLVRKQFRIKELIAYCLAGIGFVVPFALTALYFYIQQRFDDFYFITFQVPHNYGDSPSFLGYLIMMGDLLLRFFPITFFWVYAIIKGRKLVGKNQWLLFAIWIPMVLIAMYLPGKAFNHYTIQIMLPLSLVAGLFFHSEIEYKSWMNKLFRGKGSAIAFIVVVSLIQIAAFADSILQPDDPKETALYLKENLEPGEKVFVSNDEPVIYYLLRQESPSKYVHSSLIFTDLHKAFEFDNVAEVERIMAQKPKYVLIKQKNAIVESMLEPDYEFDRAFAKGKVLVYKLKSTTPQ